MKKNSLYVFLLLIFINSNIVNASTIEKGNPKGVYSQYEIILATKQKKINENYIVFFINGTPIIDYDIIIKNNRSLVPVRVISEQLGGIVDWNEKNKIVTIQKGKNKIILTIDSDKAIFNNNEILLEHPAIIYNNSTYVPLRFVAENLDAVVEYAPKLSFDYEYYYDTQMPITPANTIIREFANIIIDEKQNVSKVISKEDAMKITKQTCLKGLDNFIKSTKKSLEKSNEDIERLDNNFKDIESEINRMIYIGEISRYYKFSIGPYDILYDKYNDKIYFEIYSSATIIKEVDINDKSLFMDVFIVG